MNKEETALYQKQYKKDNKERIRSHQKKWERYNKEKIAVKQKQHWQNNKEDIKAKIDAYKATPQWKKHIRSLAYKMDSKYTGMTNRNKARGFGPLPFTKLEWILWWNVYPRLKVIVPIYNAWKATDFIDHKLALSVDRIDNTKGYTLDNIQFITVSKNSTKNKY